LKAPNFLDLSLYHKGDLFFAMQQLLLPRESSQQTLTHTDVGNAPKSKSRQRPGVSNYSNQTWTMHSRVREFIADEQIQLEQSFELVQTLLHVSVSSPTGGSQSQCL
jgi:hypothetical protein